MHSIICFGSFLFLVDLICFFWFNSIGYFETSIGIVITSVVTFLIYFICFSLYCIGVYDNFKSIKSKNTAGYLWSLAALFIALILINIYYITVTSNAGQGAGIIVALAVIPATILTFILYLIYSAFCFPILKLYEFIISKIKNKKARKYIRNTIIVLAILPLIIYGAYVSIDNKISDNKVFSKKDTIIHASRPILLTNNQYSVDYKYIYQYQNFLYLINKETNRVDAFKFDEDNNLKQIDSLAIDNAENNYEYLYNKPVLLDDGKLVFIKVIDRNFQNKISYIDIWDIKNKSKKSIEIKNDKETYFDIFPIGNGDFLYVSPDNLKKYNSKTGKINNVADIETHNWNHIEENVVRINKDNLYIDDGFKNYYIYDSAKNKIQKQEKWQDCYRDEKGYGGCQIASLPMSHRAAYFNSDKENKFFALHINDGNLYKYSLDGLKITFIGKETKKFSKFGGFDGNILKIDDNYFLIYRKQRFYIYNLFDDSIVEIPFDRDMIKTKIKKIGEYDFVQSLPNSIVKKGDMLYFYNFN